MALESSTKKKLNYLLLNIYILPLLQGPSLVLPHRPCFCCNKTPTLTCWLLFAQAQGRDPECFKFGNYRHIRNFIILLSPKHFP